MNITDILRNQLLNTIKSRTKYVDDCWLYFPTTTTTGYGDIIIDGRVRGVHRISASLFLGLDLDDKNLQVNHKSICKYRNCWNPDHIYIGTHADNMRDLISDNCKVCGRLKLLSKWSSRHQKYYKYCTYCAKRLRDKQKNK